MSETAVVGYKVLTGEQFTALQRDSRFDRAPIDRTDGYIHLSTADQLDETVAQHFGDQVDLHVAAIDLGSLGDALRWEPSRGGRLFPHLYAPLLLETVIAYGPLQRDGDGRVSLPVAG